ncbi:hypothetical protein CYLTODRAFT_418359 [Cylindrobasidium torrendii FP15055 ss-10]|uniref:Uncharacterized protein n=1 Tax=Cylindrobasidium torrendii FP15055 ss-10 TaxID=1314674 RepID=A0A0D7BP39_9AGAR|nr:hypothetical protein CYLTODRAFT_418359 [Cylindrobasidium torrendii FP15055 ss-10]
MATSGCSPLASDVVSAPWMQGLLASNDAPSPTQLTTVAEALHPLRNHLARLDADVLLAELVLVQLQRSRKAVLQAIEPLEVVRHPMRIVPDDILALIFEFCAPWCRLDDISEASFPPLSSLNRTQAPWSLSQVCRNWRALALSLPQLWATCCVRRLDPWTDMDAVRRRIQRMLDRSSSWPRRLFIDFGQAGNVRFLQWALGVSPGWSCIRAYAGSDVLHEAFHRRPLPELRRLALWGRISHTEIDAPGLYHFKQDYRHYAHGGPEVQWDRITRYESEKSHPDCLYRLTSVKELAVKFRTEFLQEAERARTGASVVPTVLGSVSVLRITEPEDRRESSLSAIAFMFEQFAFPVLRTFVFHCSQSVRLAGIPSLPHTLENLSLSYELGMDVDAVYGLLQRASTVRALHLRGNGGSEVVRRMAANPSTLPMLYDLRVTEQWIRSWGRPLADLVDSRIKGCALRKLAIFVPSSAGEEGNKIDRILWGHIRDSGVQVTYHPNEEHKF